MRSGRWEGGSEGGGGRGKEGGREGGRGEGNVTTKNVGSSYCSVKKFNSSTLNSLARL